MFKVNVAPDMGMYSLLRSQGYDPAYAIAEFIDNAIHAYQTLCPDRHSNGHELTVKLEFYSSNYKDPELRNNIVIDDNGPGIPGAHLAEALKPAKHTGEKGLSEFGIGMKAAAVWFTDTWELDTFPIEELKKYHLRFDLNSLLASGSDDINVEDTHDETTPKGTILTLKTLRKTVDFDKYNDICGTLKELYQRFTTGDTPRLKLIASFDKTPTNLRYVEPKDRQVLSARAYKTVAKVLYAIGPEKSWTVPVSIIFNGHLVEGHISLLETGSYTTNPGIVLFRNERVISGTTKHPYIPKRLIGTSNKYARQRVFGELHMDGMPVTYTKDKFEFDENAFIDQLLSIQEIQELITQAEEYRSTKKDGEPILVNSDSEIYSKTKPAAKDNSPKTKIGASNGQSGNSNSSGGAKTTPASTGAGATSSSQPQISEFVTLLISLKDKTTSVALKSIISETIYQYQWRREVSVALCMRMVLELGVLFKLERDFSSEYPKVAEKGIKAVLNYLNGNLSTFFDAKKDHRVIKCIQSTADGTQADVVLLNNVAHGHYQPSRTELNRFAINLEPLFNWAYS